MTLISGRKTERNTHIIEAETDKKEFFLQLSIYFLSLRGRDRQKGNFVTTRHIIIVFHSEAEDRDKKEILLQLNIYFLSLRGRDRDKKEILLQLDIYFFFQSSCIHDKYNFRFCCCCLLSVSLQLELSSILTRHTCPKQHTRFAELAQKPEGTGEY